MDHRTYLRESVNVHFPSGAQRSHEQVCTKQFWSLLSSHFPPWLTVGKQLPNVCNLTGFPSGQSYKKQISLLYELLSLWYFDEQKMDQDTQILWGSLRFPWVQYLYLMVNISQRNFVEV